MPLLPTIKLLKNLLIHNILPNLMFTGYLITKATLFCLLIYCLDPTIPAIPGLSEWLYDTYQQSQFFPSFFTYLNERPQVYWEDHEVVPAFWCLPAEVQFLAYVDAKQPPTLGVRLGAAWSNLKVDSSALLSLFYAAISPGLLRFKHLAYALGVALGLCSLSVGGVFLIVIAYEERKQIYLSSLRGVSCAVRFSHQHYLSAVVARKTHIEPPIKVLVTFLTQTFNLILKTRKHAREALLFHYAGFIWLQHDLFVLAEKKLEALNAASLYLPYAIFTNLSERFAAFNVAFQGHFTIFFTRYTYYLLYSTRNGLALHVIPQKQDFQEYAILFTRYNLRILKREQGGFSIHFTKENEGLSFSQRLHRRFLCALSRLRERIRVWYQKQTRMHTLQHRLWLVGTQLYRFFHRYRNRKRIRVRVRRFKKTYLWKKDIIYDESDFIE